MIDLTQYTNELLWLKKQPKLFYRTYDNQRLIVNRKDTKIETICSYDNTIIMRAVSNMVEYYISMTDDKIKYKAIYSLKDNFEISIRKTRMYLTIFGEKKKDTKKYKLDINWNPVNCTIPDELEAQILYLKMKNILT